MNFIYIRLRRRYYENSRTKRGCRPRGMAVKPSGLNAFSSAARTRRRKDSDMSSLTELQKHFINLRLGTFIHFNSATFQFNEGAIEDWEYGHENNGEPRRWPFCEKDWNPAALDCRQWASIAKSAGCRFAALTAKHHEGFALWPTAYSEHCVRNAANQTDVVAEYLKAFREAGIEAGLYFSVLDITAGINRKSCTPRQKALIKGELMELLTNYGKIPFLILDGWNAFWGGPTYEMLPFEELDSLVKALQPDCLLMNIGCTEGISGTDILFFENSAGQEVDSAFRGPGISCNKLTRTWYWRHDDPVTKVKSASWALEKMNQYFPMNVNFIMNLSPNTAGRVDDNLAAEFARIGERVAFPAPLTELPEGWLRR